MAVDYIIYALVSLLSALAAFYLTNNLIFLIVILISYCLFFVTYEIAIKKKERTHFARNKDLVIFIHDFFLLYSVNDNLKEVISNASNNVSKRLKEEINLLDEFPAREKLDRLANYFISSLYVLFLKTVDLCQGSNDDKIKTISFLLEENNRYLFNQKILQRNIWRSLCEFALLWIISFVILLMIRLAVNSYFVNLSKAWFYLLGISLYFVFFLFSIFLFMYSTHRSIKRYAQ